LEQHPHALIASASGDAIPNDDDDLPTMAGSKLTTYHHNGELRPMTNDITKRTSTSMIDWSQDPFEQRAAAVSQTGAPLKFSKGRWFTGFGDNEQPADGKELVADIGGLMIGWRCWKEKKIVDVRIGYFAEGYRPPQRNELGDLDDSTWERDANGKPKDPWSSGYYLRLLDLDGEESFVFSATSKGSRDAVDDMIVKFTKQRKKDPTRCTPVVKLAADWYRHKDFGRVDTPELKIVDWRSSDGVAAAIPSPDGSDDAEFNDDIPY
jgi:hypothetical protein